MSTHPPHLLACLLHSLEPLLWSVPGCDKLPRRFGVLPCPWDCYEGPCHALLCCASRDVV